MSNTGSNSSSNYIYAPVEAEASSTADTHKISSGSATDSDEQENQLTVIKDSWKKSLQLAKYYRKKNKFDKCMREYVRHVAYSELLTMTPTASSNMHIANAYYLLAEAYLNVKHYPNQARAHAEHALAILKKNLPHKMNKNSTLKSLVQIYGILGYASLAQERHDEAKMQLKPCLQLVKKLKELHGRDDDKLKQLRLNTFIGLARAELGEKRKESACLYAQNALVVSDELQRTTDRSDKITILLLLAEASNDRDDCIRYLQDAKYEAEKQYGEVDDKTMDILLRLVAAHLTRGTDESVDSCEELLTTALAAAGDGQSLSERKRLQVIDELVKLHIKQERFDEGKHLLLDSQNAKCDVFGYISDQVAESHQLLASIHLITGDMDDAVQCLQKCLDMQLVMYGRHHKQTKSTQASLDMFTKNNSKTSTSRPPFLSTVGKR